MIYLYCLKTIQKNKTGIQKLKATRDSNYIYKNELYKACFQHNIAYGDFKDLPRRTESEKVLHNITFEFANNLNMINIRVGLL